MEGEFTKFEKQIKITRTKDTSLLILEKKLDNGDTHEIIKNKFILKPEMNTKGLFKGQDFFKEVGSFLKDFKDSTEKMINNPEEFESKKIENVSGDKSEGGKYIQMNLALGVLDLLPKKEEDHSNKLDNIKLKADSNIDLKDLQDVQHPLLDNKADMEILNFLMKNSQRKRRRIHKIKNKNSNN